ncbi:MAG TPA: AAA family ATPase [Dermatophilaceae bacterium]|nr:AAA family ATPase [Dermatophilaceae bacterium]
MIVMATASTDLKDRMLQATSGDVFVLPLGPLPLDPAHLFAQILDPTPPKVVILDAALDLQAALQLAMQFDQQCPAVSVILVSEDGQQIGLDAMRAGVRDIIEPADDIADIRDVLDRALQAARDRSLVAEMVNHSVDSDDSSGSGRVISVVSPKGGVGKTTIATNIAVGLARALPSSTVLLDLDVQFGDVASALDLEPEYTLSDTVHGPASRDAMVLKTFLTQHQTGLYVICGPRSPADADNISGRDISQLIKMLTSEFQYVVIDTAPGLSEPTLAALDNATDMVLLTSMDVPGIRGLRKEIDTLSDLGLSSETRHVVLNFVDNRGGLSLADVEATIGTAVDLTLPRSKAATPSVNQGIPLLQSGVRDPLTKQLGRLLSRFLPSPAPASTSVLRFGHRTRTESSSPPKPRRAKPGWYPGVQAGA